MSHAAILGRSPRWRRSVVASAEVTYLRANLTGGDSAMPALYSAYDPTTVTSSGGVASKWTDARGSGSYGPDLTSTGTKRPGWDGSVFTFDGVDDVLYSSAISSVFDLSSAVTMAIICAPLQTAAGGYIAAIAESASTVRFMALFQNLGAAGTLATETVGSTLDKFATSTATVTTTRRLIVSTKNATTTLAIEVPNSAQVSNATGGVIPSGNNALTLGAYWNTSPSPSKPVLRAVLLLNRVATAGDLTTIKSWAQTYHTAVLI